MERRWNPRHKTMRCFYLLRGLRQWHRAYGMKCNQKEAEEVLEENLLSISISISLSISLSLSLFECLKFNLKRTFFAVGETEIHSENHGNQIYSVTDDPSLCMYVLLTVSI